MKRMEYFCASPASIAVCSSLDRRSVSYQSHGHIDHRTPSRLHDNRKDHLHVPCSSQLPINPKPHHEKNRKSSARHNYLPKTSSPDANDQNSPPGSFRYLLGDSPFLDGLSLQADQPVKSMQLSSHNNSVIKHCNTLVRSMSSRESPALRSLPPARSLSSLNSPALRTSSSAHSRDQVVVLMVAIHCKGCEGKVRKHISKMEGVRSFSIDLETKKVTIIGEVTPLGVLASVSKVKYAQFWPSPLSSSSSPSI